MDPTSSLSLRPAWPITTERLLLRPMVADDLDAFHQLHAREDVVRYLYWEPRTREEAAELLARRLPGSVIEAEGDAIHVAALLRTGGTFVGHLHLQYVNATHGLGEIGYSLHPSYGGKGYATEATRELLRMGFEGLGLHRIIGRCDARNDASGRLMARLGMRPEAHFRENEWIKGEWTDELVYAMLASEWPSRG